jgi:sec-independent protein translocase protein TatC
LLTSVILFGFGLLFAYYVLIPAALNFFIGYSTDVIEPIWSFDQYFDFILFVFYSTGLSFQVPIIQIILGLAGIVSGQQMLALWRYIVLASTIISAVLTPSTDPVTQLCLAGAIMFLYFTGASILILYKK